MTSLRGYAKDILYGVCFQYQYKPVIELITQYLDDILTTPLPRQFSWQGFNMVKNMFFDSPVISVISTGPYVLVVTQSGLLYELSNSQIVKIGYLLGYLPRGPSGPFYVVAADPVRGNSISIGYTPVRFQVNGGFDTIGVVSDTLIGTVGDIAFSSQGSFLFRVNGLSLVPRDTRLTIAHVFSRDREDSYSYYDRVFVDCGVPGSLRQVWLSKITEANALQEHPLGLIVETSGSLISDGTTGCLVDQL
jgi:hypothetical protein